MFIATGIETWISKGGKTNEYWKVLPCDAHQFHGKVASYQFNLLEEVFCYVNNTWF